MFYVSDFPVMLTTSLMSLTTYGSGLSPRPEKPNNPRLTVSMEKSNLRPVADRLGMTRRLPYHCICRAGAGLLCRIKWWL